MAEDHVPGGVTRVIRVFRPGAANDDGLVTCDRDAWMGSRCAVESQEGIGVGQNQRLAQINAATRRETDNSGFRHQQSCSQLAGCGQRARGAVDVTVA